MTKVIILSDETLDTFYERTQQYFHQKFHTCPSSLSGRPVPEEEAAQLSYYEALAQGLAEKSKGRDRYHQDGERDHQPWSSKWPCGRSLGKMVF
jgi:hypothetical protein